MAGITVTTDIDIPKAIKKIDNDKFWTFAAKEWHKHYKHYVPYRTGNLYNNVTIRPKEIEHNAGYAKDVYLINRNYRRGKHEHMFATCQWDKHAVPTQGPRFIQSLQNYIDRGLV
ncbi:MAG: hypothetical protein IIW54_12045 [Lachnospiraceae bacterium]|nr:hypothetical protein [Lachnospiraceae bacterium]